MSTERVRVLNRTGRPQVVYCDGRSVLLEPGVWSDPLPGSEAMHIVRMGIDVELGMPESSASSYLWKDGDGLHVQWLSPFSMGDGYATAAENTVHALIRNGLNLSVGHLWFLVRRGLKSETLRLISEGLKDDRLHALGLCLATPGEFKKIPTSYRIGWTMYESSNPLVTHPEWRHECNGVDRLFVPSEWCKEIFGYFVKKPIDVAPLSISDAYCAPLKRKPGRLFNIICYATLTDRKAPLETLQVFYKAFPREKYPDVRMHFKTRLGYFGYGEGQLPDIDDDRVTISSENWLPQRMARYLDEADLHLWLSKGEGFAMTPRETMAMGIPTTVPENTAHLDFVDDRYNWPIPCTGPEVSPLGGDWYLVDWNYAIDVARWIYHNREEAYAKAYEGAKWLIDTHGPDANARKVLGHLGAIEPFALRTEIRAEIAKLTREEEKSLQDGLKRLLDRASLPSRCNLRLVTAYEPAAQFLKKRGYAIDIGANQTDTLYVGDLHTMRDGEIYRQFTKLLQTSSRVMFVIPSVFRERTARDGERLLRIEQWQDILRPFGTEFLNYTADKTAIYGSVDRHSGAKRGTMIRTQGKTRQNVWRPRA